jgi:3-phenylpropionate/trans-cinnamate dioxygenase ferredoxin subunit
MPDRDPRSHQEGGGHWSVFPKKPTSTGHLRERPAGSEFRRPSSEQPKTAAGSMMVKWINACATDDIEEEEVIRFDHDGRTFAIFRSPEDEFFCTEGLCTHEKVHLCDGLVMDYTIECPKHNGMFDYRTGEALRAPVCVNLKTYGTKVEDGRVFIEI